MEILRKAATIKEVTEKGLVLAVFSTLNVIDKDGDITLPGFFGQQATVMLPVHNWGHVPIGKGTIRESGDQGLAELKMNLEIPAAKDWHSALLFDLKEGAAPLQEWSYGFTILPGCAADGEQDGRRVRMLRPDPKGGPGCRVHEVSPVLVGAGEGTHTLAAKGAAEEGTRFADDLDAALAAVTGVVGRASALAALRAKEGRGLAAANAERLAKIAEALKGADGSIHALLAAHDAPRRGAMKEYGRYLRGTP